MSGNDGLVSVKKDNGQKLQWAKGLIYTQEGSKLIIRRKSIRVMFIVGVIFSSISILFVDTNVIEEKKAEIKKPNVVSKNSIITFDTFKERKEVKRKRYVRPIKIMPLSLISREGEI